MVLCHSREQPCHVFFGTLVCLCLGDAGAQEAIEAVSVKPIAASLEDVFATLTEPPA